MTNELQRSLCLVNTLDKNTYDNTTMRSVDELVLRFFQKSETRRGEQALMRRRIHTCHMRRRIHTCHMRSGEQAV